MLFDGMGPEWSRDVKLLQPSVSGTAIIANHHVIEKCIDNSGKLSVALLYKKEKPAELVSFDEKNDVAILRTDLKVKALELSEFAPWPGYWVMALGSADAFEGSVAFGSD